jgi:hypothetical protein
MNFKPTKRKMIAWSIVSIFLLFYVPTVRCIDGIKTGASTCNDLGLCDTDYYYSVGNLLLGQPCTSISVNIPMLLLLTALLLSVTYVIICVADSYYSRYRDV